MKRLMFWILLPLALPARADGLRVDMNGEWEYGLSRNYTGRTLVPGVPLDPCRMTGERLWYRREVTLPGGNWKRASLELYGARFCPEVWVDGMKVSSAAGGMALTVHELEGVLPWRKINLEVSLAPLSAVPQTDASYIPPADQWRSNVSSCLWDDVVLHLDGGARVLGAVPRSDTQAKQLTIKYNAQGPLAGCDVLLTILDGRSRPLVTRRRKAAAKGSFVIDYKGVLEEWMPARPRLYTLRVELLSGPRRMDLLEQDLGIKNFEAGNKRFLLNGWPCTLRGGTVVWHRWMRDAEGRGVGYDTTWFRDNIVLRLKDHGANYLRFHLGMPPRRLASLCDRYGLLVPWEWSFFHGMPASRESLMEQYPVWMDRAMTHPSVAFYQPYNETEGDQLQTVWSALDELCEDYPPVAMAERDVLHIHKYWWSLFENLGLYYDSAAQFDRPVMVDEFGGNYLDGHGELGGYTSLKESYLRFLGPNSTPEGRLRHLEQSNARVAEYWRRIGAAGVAPFTIAGSWEDGNTWFLGPLREGRPKSVWNALTVAWSPVAASLDLWDRNFRPGQRTDIPVHLFNETGAGRIVAADVCVRDASGRRLDVRQVSALLEPYSRRTVTCTIAMPDDEGEYFVEALTLDPPREVKYPVLSSWDVRVIEARVPDAVRKTGVAIPGYEWELRTFARERGLHVTDRAPVVVLSRATWERIAAGDAATKEFLREAIDSGRSVLMLDVGERYLGQGYPRTVGELGPLQSVARVTDPQVTRYELLGDVHLLFTETAEPESHIHPHVRGEGLWNGLGKHYAWLWNGLRGGLIVPAADMEVQGLSPAAFESQWVARGADPGKMRSGNYYAYELYGIYAFSERKDDREIQKALRDKVEFLVTDAPALAGAINLRTPVRVTDLAGQYRASQQGMAQRFTPLVDAGKNLTRNPVVEVDFGAGRGRLILSQLLTAERLAPARPGGGPWDIRRDECAAQMVLNMIGKLTEPQ